MKIIDMLANKMLFVCYPHITLIARYQLGNVGLLDSTLRSNVHYTIR